MESPLHLPCWVNTGSIKEQRLNFARVYVTLRKEGDDGLSSLHINSLRRAVAAVITAGQNVPDLTDLTVYFCTSQNIPKLAMKTYLGGNDPVLAARAEYVG